MRKLSSLNNLICLVLLLAACRQSPTPKTGNNTDNKAAVGHSNATIDTSKKADANFPGKGDTIPTRGQGRAVIHNAPDQEKLDSIKNAKTKLKKPY